MRLISAYRKTAPWIWWLLPVVAIGGWFYPYLGLFVLICMLAPVVIGMFRGRYWCGWLCPRGAFFDFIMSRVSRKRHAPTWVRSKAFRLSVMAFLMGMMGVQLTLAWPNGEQMARVFIVLLGVTTVAGMVLAIVYSPRTWCTFCPMGTMASFVSHGKQPLAISSDCRQCGACTRVCPMALSPEEVDASHADCIKCGNCIARCPVNALLFAKQKDAAADATCRRCA